MLERGRTVVGIEVKSGRASLAHSGLAAVGEAFDPTRTLLVGGDGIVIREFLSRTVIDATVRLRNVEGLRERRTAAPIAKPTSASSDASLMPSPTMPTARPRPFCSAMAVALYGLAALDVDMRARVHT